MMINSYKQLTGKYLKANKKRTLLTIIGIILSVALISTIGLIYISMEFNRIEQVKNSEGRFHLVYTKVDDNLMSMIENNPKVSRYGLYNTNGQVKVGENFFANIIEGNNKALELFIYRVSEGRLPEKENEIAVEKIVLEQIDNNARIGDKIRFNNKEYTLIGIINNQESSELNKTGVVLSINNNMDKEKSALVVEVSSKTKLKTALLELKQLTDERYILENGLLISVEGGDDSGTGMGAIGNITIIIIGIVMVCSIAVIYNSFQISIVERIKQLGLLRAVGATKKQIKKIVLGEATIMAIIAVPIGLLFGIIFIYGLSLTFKIISTDSFLAMKPVIDIKILGICALIGVGSVYLSALVPVIFASKISPIVSISSAATIKKEKIKRRRNILVNKIFGFEGAMAAKNIKRNKNRYIVTIFSIVLSVVLFVTFNYAINTIAKTDSIPDELKNIDFSVVPKISDNRIATDGKINESIGNDQSVEQIIGTTTGASEENKIDKGVVENIKKLPYVDKVYEDYEVYFFEGLINKEAEIKEVQDMLDIYSTVRIDGIEKTLIQTIVAVYDKEAMELVKNYIREGNIDLQEINKENGVIVVSKKDSNRDDNKYEGPMANLKIGDEIELQDNNLKVGEEKPDFGKGYINKVKVMAIVEVEPFMRMGNMKGIQLITTEEVATNLTKDVVVKPIGLKIKIKDSKQEEAAKKAIENELAGASDLGIINHLYENRVKQASDLMMKILVYGFILIISLIGSVNTVNTLTTNIILRNKEFAALKSIGLTQRGLKKIIVLEGLLYGITGTIYGAIISIGLCYLIYISLYNIDFAFVVPWGAIGIAGLAALLIGYVSVLAPLSRIKKENIIEAIRED